MIDVPKRALVVTPHPDDAEISCGGTVGLWTSQGASVYYVLCSDGGKGTDDPGVTSEALAKTRHQEQLDAAATLGVKEVVALGYPDGELEDTREFRRELVRAIRRFRPEVVVCPDPYRRSFYYHRDHRITGQVTQDAVFPYARDRLHFPEHEAEGLEPHKVGTLLLWGAEESDSYVDVTAAMDLKIEALRCHKSQLAGLSGENVVTWLRGFCREAGEKAGFEYAEGYRKVEFRTS